MSKVLKSTCRKLLCLSACKKWTSSITSFFLNILQRNTKLVILGNLDKPGHTPKVMLSIWRNFWCLSADQKSTFSLIYHKDITNLLFWELWTCMVTQHPKWYYQLVENVCAYLSAKGLNSSPRFSGDVVKISKLLILGRLDMPGYAHPNW